MISKTYPQKIRDELDHCSNPLFFFDDDPDGLCSFLLLYRYKREGHGVIVKAKPYLSAEFVRKVEEYNPDKIFVLDMPNVSQEFLDAVKVPVIWVDHHPPQDRDKVIYVNPRLTNETAVPTSYLCYKAVQQDMWIAMIGCISDWFIPDFKDEFCTKYPTLADPTLKTPPDYLFQTQVGKLIKIFSFNLKGKTSEAIKSLKILSRIKEPHDLLTPTTSQAKLLYKKYEQIEGYYVSLKKSALAEEEKTKKEPFLCFIYEENKISLTKDLSNELLYLFPKKVIILGRKKSGQVKCSLRTTTHALSDALAKALVGISGYGGGHEHACGCCIKEEDFPRFLDNLKKELDL